jgi:hypothetical protein
VVELRFMGESRYDEVHVRRKKQNERVVPTMSLVPSLLTMSTLTLETSTPFTSYSKYTGDMVPLSTPPTPLSVRQTSRKNARVLPDRYGFPHDIAKFVSYSHISSIYEAFIASLDIVSIPKCWQVPKRSEMESGHVERAWDP